MANDVDQCGSAKIAAIDVFGSRFPGLSVPEHGGYLLKINKAQIATMLLRGSCSAARAARPRLMWRIEGHVDAGGGPLALTELAQMYNPCIRGWITYYSHFYKTQLRPWCCSIRATSIHRCAAIPWTQLWRSVP